MEILHPSWQLGEIGTEIESQLFRRARSKHGQDHRRWAQLVDELASPVFTKRQNAERELSRAGQAVVPYLQNLDRRKLDAEQAYRVRSLVESMAAGYEDSAERIVVWLAGDENVWLSLLNRTDPEQRRLAATRLSAILDQPLNFRSRSGRSNPRGTDRTAEDAAEEVVGRSIAGRRAPSALACFTEPKSRASASAPIPSPTTRHPPEAQAWRCVSVRPRAYRSCPWRSPSRSRRPRARPRRRR